MPTHTSTPPPHHPQDGPRGGLALLIPKACLHCGQSKVTYLNKLIMEKDVCVQSRTRRCHCMDSSHLIRMNLHAQRHNEAHYKFRAPVARRLLTTTFEKGA